MNKKVYELFVGLGLHQTSKSSFEGELNGYKAWVGYFPMQPMSIRVLLPVYVPQEEQRKIISELAAYRGRFFNVSFDHYGMIILLDSWTASSFPKQWEKMMPKVFALLEKYEVSKLPLCASCGKELTPENSRNINIKGVNCVMCFDCIDKINETIDAINKDIDKQPGSYLKGFLGGLLGALCGTVLYIIISLFGFISAISGLVGAALGYFFAEKFGGKKNALMYIIIALTNIAVVALTVYSLYVFVAYGAALESSMNVGPFEAFAHYLKDPEFSRTFIGELLGCGFFTILGVLFPLIKRLSTLKKQGKI